MKRLSHLHCSAFMQRDDVLLLLELLEHHGETTQTPQCMDTLSDAFTCHGTVGLLLFGDDLPGSVLPMFGRVWQPPPVEVSVRDQSDG